MAYSDTLPYGATMYSSTYDYNYPTITLLNVTSAYHQAYIIDLPFHVRFQGVSYNSFKVSSDSYVEFGSFGN